MVRPYRDEWIMLLQSTAARPDEVFVKPVPLIKTIINSSSPSPMHSLNELAATSIYFTGSAAVAAAGGVRALSPPPPASVAAGIAALSSSSSLSSHSASFASLPGSKLYGGGAAHNKRTTVSPTGSVTSLASHANANANLVVSPAAMRPLIAPLSLRPASPHASGAATFSSPSSAFKPPAAASLAAASSSSSSPLSLAPGGPNGTSPTTSDAGALENASLPASASISGSRHASLRDAAAAVPIPPPFQVGAFASPTAVSTRQLRARPASVTVTGATTFAPSPKHSPKHAAMLSASDGLRAIGTPLAIAVPMTPFALGASGHGSGSGMGSSNGPLTSVSRVEALPPPSSAADAVGALPEGLLGTAAAIDLLHRAPPAHVRCVHPRWSEMRRARAKIARIT
jgi:hypothetical protein